MYLTDYLFSQELYSNVISQLINEQDGAQFDPSQLAGQIPQEEPETVEFENLKSYILYGKLKEIKYHLNNTKYDNSDDKMKTILEFIDLVTVFYNSFHYLEICDIFNNILEMISTELKISLPKALTDIPDEKKTQSNDT